MPWPTRTPAAPTPEPSSTRSSRGASSTTTPSRWSPRSRSSPSSTTSSLFIVPKHIWENVPVADWRNDPGATGADPSRVIGSGPWKFQEWRQGESVTLSAMTTTTARCRISTPTSCASGRTRPLSSTRCSTAKSTPPRSSQPTSPPSKGHPGSQVAHYPTRGFTLLRVQSRPRGDHEVAGPARAPGDVLRARSGVDRQRHPARLCRSGAGDAASRLLCLCSGPDHDQVHLRSREGQVRCSPRPAGPTATATALSTRTASASPSSCSTARLADCRSARRLHAGCLASHRRRRDAAMRWSSQL